MLIRFAATNSRSIHERQELSLVASAFYKDRKEVLIPCDVVPTGSLVPTAVIYGPNAAGKSNIIRAVEFLQSSVQYSQTRGNPEGRVPREAFALSEVGAREPTAVEIEFIHEGTRYQYGFEATDRAFIGEWLYWFPHRTRQVLFERIGEKKLRFGRNLKGQNKVISELMRANSLFLSAAAQNSHEQLSKVHTYLLSIQFQSAGQPSGAALHLAKLQFDERIITFLAGVGTGITGFKTKREIPSDEQRRFISEFTDFSERHVGGDLNAKGELARYLEREDYSLQLQHPSDTKQSVYFDADQESAGTRRLLLILSSVFSALDWGPSFLSMS